MADPAAHDPEPGATVELMLRDLHERLPAAREDLQDQLPGLEPERRITDWGRSERVEGAVDRTLYRFLYRYWFRVEVEGVENVPSDGGALLIANHAGAIPPDGAMIAKAIREEHPRPRAVHLMTERAWGGVPLLGMLVTKLGAVPAHTANAQRLLFDERALVLSFPEGSTGTRKPIKERYRLRRFCRDALLEAAIRAAAPIVPIAVLGAEEAMPVIARINPLRRLTRLPVVPVTTALPLPAKFRIRFLEPVETDTFGEFGASDHGAVERLGEQIRGLIQENLLEMVAGRQSVWLG